MKRVIGADPNWDGALSAVWGVERSIHRAELQKSRRGGVGWKLGIVVPGIRYFS
jgi:hypothetical protein